MARQMRGKRASFRRTVARSLVVLALAVVGFILAGLPVYVFPAREEVGTVDIIYVIGPPTDDRMDVAREIHARNVSASMLVSVGKPGWGWTEDDIPECLSGRAECVIPRPFTTRGEARELNAFVPDVAQPHAVVVTFTPHVARTRYTFARCYEGDVTVVGVDPEFGLMDWAYQYLYQTAAWVKAIFEPCAHV